MTSKRKSTTTTVLMSSDDMIFEDQDGNEDGTFTETTENEAESASSVSRVSGRVKKSKAIYDPSEHNGPVHKRKKEALEAEKNKSQKTPTKSSKHVTGEPQLQTASQPTPPSSSPVKIVKSATTPIKASSKAFGNRRKTVDLVNKRAQIVKPASIGNRGRKLSVIPPAPVVKEPSNRIQQRKLVKDEKEKPKVVPASPPAAAKTNGCESTSPKTDVNDQSDLPDVRKWTHIQVANYFSSKLHFSKEDAAVFKDEEIDGEALMIMKREDLISPKLPRLKLGTAIKMWTKILNLQTDSHDPTQAWK